MKGDHASRDRIRRLMAQMGLSSIYNRQRSKNLIHSKNARNLNLPNLVRGNSFDLPYQAVSSDISFVLTGEGFLYLCAIKDIVTGEILGHATSGNLKKELVINALTNATAKHSLGSQTIFHSDRGSQYTSKEFMALVMSYGIKQSFSRIGVPGDNSWSESFFSCLKRERTYFEHFATKDEATDAAGSWIDEFYNTRRLQKRLGYLSPREYRRAVFAQKA